MFFNFQERIQEYLETADFSKAFDEALSAQDLSVVLFVCQSVRPQDVLSGKEACLSQPIILSLIQQLSADLTNETVLKVKWVAFISRH